MRRWWTDYEPSRPRPAEGGIRTRSRRGPAADTWWGRRWLEVLERLDVGARLQRGRAYARQGQVLGIHIAAGEVTARVQGSRVRPYRVTLRLRPLPGRARRRVARVLAEHVGLAAKLLAGELPPEIEAAFDAAGVSLFPLRAAELETACTCPDWSNPCKHVAAVYYLLAEEFDRDPFLIFRLRGLEREELLELMEAGSPRAAGAGPVAEAGPAAGAGPMAETGPAAGAGDAADAAAAGLEAGSRAVDAGSFWQGGHGGWGGEAPEGAEAPEGGASPPPLLPPEGDRPGPAAALCRQPGPFPFWRGTKPLADLLEPTYVRASRRAREVLAALAPAPEAVAPGRRFRES